MTGKLEGGDAATPRNESRDAGLDIGGSPAAHTMREIARRRVDAERKLGEQLKEAQLGEEAPSEEARSSGPTVDKEPGE